MKAVAKRSVNWLDIVVISFVLFLIVLLLVPLNLTLFIVSYGVIFAIVSGFFYILKAFNKQLSIGFDSRVNSINWLAIIIIVLGALMIVNLLTEATRNWQYQPGFLLVLAGGGLIISSMYLFKWRKKPKVAIDERVKDVTNRSARNALIATWFGLFIVGGSHFGWVGNLSGLTAYGGSVEPIGSGEILAIAVAGFTAFIASFLIYSHKADLSGGGK